MSGRIGESEWIWKDGDFIRWGDAKVHVLSLAVQFGNSVFEGIRCYETPSGPAIFRLPEHIRRLCDSCKVYRMDLPHSAEDLAAACVAVVDRNNLRSCYVRPTIVRGYGAAGMYPVESPVECYIAAWPWGAYLGPEALSQGVDVCVTSWHRPAPNTFPAVAKSAGHYNNAQLMKMEAMANGYAEAIALGPSGLVSEGSGQNVFLVRDGVLITPQSDGTWLFGVTRDAVLTIAADLDIPVKEMSVPREMLYTADELFFSGTATEVTPIRSVDRITVGKGRGGPVTMRIQEHFLKVAQGEIPDHHGWLTHVKSLVGAH
jgi:branched-chain amino acid aminotransferase